jgi:hypothetical protein
LGVFEEEFLPVQEGGEQQELEGREEREERWERGGKVREDTGLERGNGRDGENGRNGGWGARAGIGLERGGGEMGAQQAVDLMVEEGLGFEAVVELAGIRREAWVGGAGGRGRRTEVRGRGAAGGGRGAIIAHNCLKHRAERWQMEDDKWRMGS